MFSSDRLNYLPFRKEDLTTFYKWKNDKEIIIYYEPGVMSSVSMEQL